MSKENPRCPKCKGTTTVRTGPYGEFFGCDSYPECDGTARVRKRMPSAEEQKELKANFQRAMDYVLACGGVEEAYRWLRAVEAVLEVQK